MELKMVLSHTRFGYCHGNFSGWRYANSGQDMQTPAIPSCCYIYLAVNSEFLFLFVAPKRVSGAAVRLAILDLKQTCRDLGPGYR